MLGSWSEPRAFNVSDENDALAFGVALSGLKNMTSLNYNFTNLIHRDGNIWTGPEMYLDILSVFTKPVNGILYKFNVNINSKNIISVY